MTIWGRTTIAGIDRWLGGLAERRLPAVLLLTIFALVLFLPGFFSLPPVDEDEVLYAQAARQMAVSRDFVDIRFGTAPRYKKPAGIYWLQAGADLLTGDPGNAPIWVNRLPSLVAAVGAVVLTYWIGVTLVSGGVGFLGALMLASSILMGFEARMATTDAVLSVVTLAGIAALAHLYKQASTQHPVHVGRAVPLSFWLALSASVLVKGPIAPMVVGLTAAGSGALSRSWGWLKGVRPLSGLILFALLTAPWFVAIWFVSHGTFYASSVGGDLLGKLGRGQEGHGAPFGSYALTLFVYFWPVAPLVIFGVPFAFKRRREPWVWFCLSWVVPSWLIFEAVASKLPTYVLPLLPGLALLSAAGLHEAQQRAAPKWRLLAMAILLLPGLALPLLIAHTAEMFGQHLPWWSLAAFAGALAAVVAALLALRLCAPFAAVVLLALAGLGVASGFYPAGARIAQLWTAREIAGLVDGFDGCDRPSIVASGYTEPSLVFWLGRKVVRGWPRTVVSIMSNNTCALGLVEEHGLAAVRDGLAKAGVAVRELGAVDGLDLNQGHRVKVHVLARIR